ncbi:hypothetical protein VZT92_023007 [Zoarces viviparus]|uniref:Uncharacterized protein n=1 Tax=Zoarces viviparus TaxID=48416 RepID=A0AAW1E656_ZOAVI
MNMFQEQQVNVTVMHHAAMNTGVSGLSRTGPPTQPAFPPQCWVPSRVGHDSLPAGGGPSPPGQNLYMQMDSTSNWPWTHGRN